MLLYSATHAITLLRKRTLHCYTNFRIAAQYFGEVLDSLPAEQRPLQCMLAEGETIFIPSGWWHTVLNVVNTVAVTGNFMNDANAQHVVGELQKRPPDSDAPMDCLRSLMQAGRRRGQEGHGGSVPSTGDKNHERA